MNDLLKLHKTVGGNGLNKLTYREYLDEHFNLGELKDVTSINNKLEVTGDKVPLELKSPFDEDLLFYINFSQGIVQQYGDCTTSCVTPSIVDSLRGKGMSFTTANNILCLDKVVVPTEGEFTLRLKFKMLSSITKGLFFIQNNNKNSEGSGLEWSGTTLIFFNQIGNTKSALSIPTSNIPIGSWVELVCSGNLSDFKNTVKIYINEKPITGTFSTTTITGTFSGRTTIFGGINYGGDLTYNLNAIMDSIEIYKSIKTPSTLYYEIINKPNVLGHRISPPIELPKNIVSSKIDWEGEGKINIIGLENGEIPYDIHADINDNTLIYLQGHNFKDYSNYNRELKGTNKVKFRDNAMSLNGRFLKTTTQDKTSYIKGTDFTVEFWGKCNSLPVIKWNSFFEINNETGVSVPDEFRIGLHDTTNNLIAIVGKTRHSYATPLPLNEWHHYCLTRQGSTVYGFIDGVLKFQDSNSSSLTGNTLYLGHNAYSTDQHLDCDIKEFMVSDVCKYTSNFTPKHNSFNISERYLIPCENGKAITSKLPRNIVLEQTIKDTEYISNVNLSIKHSKVHDVMTPTLLAEQGDSKELYLYDSGNEFDKVTGGWKGHQWDTSFTAGYFSKKDTYLEYGDNTSNYRYGGFVTNSGIDLTPYSTLYVDFQFVSYSASGYSADHKICVCQDNTPTIRNQKFDYVHSVSNAPGRYQVEIDISNYNGIYYLGVQGQSGAYNNHTNIQRLYSMKLIK